VKNEYTVPDFQTGPVGRQELLKHACFDDIQIRLVTEIGIRKNPDLNFIEWHREVNPRKDRWVGNDILSAYVQYRDKAFGYQIAGVERNDLFGRYGYWFLLDYRNRPVRWPRARENVLMSDGYSTPEAAMDAAHDDLREKFSSLRWRAEGKKWQYETLDGEDFYGVAYWLNSRDIQVLNVAGPREGRYFPVYNQARSHLTGLFRQLLDYDHKACEPCVDYMTQASSVCKGIVKQGRLIGYSA